MVTGTRQGSWLRGDVGVLVGLALVKLLLHLPILGRYGYHHDELYYSIIGIG